MLMTNKEAEEKWKAWPDKDTEEGRDAFFRETSWMPTATGYLILVLTGKNPNDRISS
jgi:hypothetical protein